MEGEVSIAGAEASLEGRVLAGEGAGGMAITQPCPLFGGSSKISTEIFQLIGSERVMRMFFKSASRQDSSNIISFSSSFQAGLNHRMSKERLGEVFCIPKIRGVRIDATVFGSQGSSWEWQEGEEMSRVGLCRYRQFHRTRPGNGIFPG